MNNLGSVFIKWFVYIFSFITIGLALFIVGYVIVMGVPNLRPELFAWKYTTDNVSMLPAIINTIIMVVLVLIMVIPVGILSAIFLVEYSKENKAVKLIHIAAETLAGIPSIIYGLFGMLFFVNLMKWGLSMISGAATLAIMVLPVVMRTTSEALKSIPDTFREGSFGLGAGKLRTVFKIVLPPAVPGILSGVILSVGRIIGETAALIFTAGTIAKVPAVSNLLFSSGRTMAVHMYLLASEGLYVNQAYATAFVLLVFVVIMNGISNLIGKRLGNE